MVRDLQQVDAWQPGRQEARIHALLDVAREQEPPRADGPEDHDGHVVDARPVVRRVAGDLAADGPQDAQLDPVHGQPIARGQAGSRRGLVTDETIVPRRVARARAAHPGLEDLPDPISIEQEREPSCVVFMRVRQDHGVDPAVPWGDQAIELDEQAIGIGATVDEQASTPAPFDEDRIALADIEHGDPRHTRGP